MYMASICAKNAAADKISYDNEMKQRVAFLRNRVMLAGPKGLDLERAEAMIRWAQLVNWDNLCGDTADCGGCGGYDVSKKPKHVPHQDSAIEECALCDRTICVWCLPRCFFSFDRYQGEWTERYNKDGEVKNPDLSRNELLINETVFYSHENIPRRLICPGCVDAWRARKARKAKMGKPQPAKPAKKLLVKKPQPKKPLCKKPQVKKVEEDSDEEDAEEDADSVPEFIDFQFIQEQFRAAEELQAAAKQLQENAMRLMSKQTSKQTAAKRHKTN